MENTVNCAILVLIFYKTLNSSTVHRYLLSAHFLCLFYLEKSENLDILA